MDELLACFLESGEAGQMEGFSWGIRLFQTAAVGSQWRKEKGGRGGTYN